MPIKNARFYQTLGLAMRAGILSSGEYGALKALRAGDAAFILVDEEASENTKKEFRDGCAYHSVPCWETEAGRLAGSTGKSGRMVAAVCKGPLAEKLMMLTEQPEP